MRSALIAWDDSEYVTEFKRHTVLQALDPEHS